MARMVKDLEQQMKTAAKSLEFEKAALFRDQVDRAAQSHGRRPVGAARVRAVIVRLAGLEAARAPGALPAPGARPRTPIAPLRQT